MCLVIEQGGEEEHDESEDEDTDDYESDQGKFICHYNTIRHFIFVYFILFSRSVYYALCTNSVPPF